MNTTYYQNLVAGNLFGITGTTALPGEYWIGISKTAPAADGTGVTEPSRDATGYARAQLDNLAKDDTVAGQVKNGADISLPKSLTEWCSHNEPATHYVIFDGPDAGANLLISDELEEPRIVQKNSYVKWDAGSLTIKIV